MKKKRRFPLSVAILLPLFAAILFSEIGLYLAAYFVLNETITDAMKADDARDLGLMQNIYSENDYTIVGYAVTPVIHAYEEAKPAEPFVPGSAEEKEYQDYIVKSASWQLYQNCQRILDRYVTDFAGIFYEDTQANRMVLVCLNNVAAGSGIATDTSLYLGSFFRRDSLFDEPSFYGVDVQDVNLGRLFTSGIFLSEVKHPTMPAQYGGPYKVWLVRETLYDSVYAALPSFTRYYAVCAAAALLALFGLAYVLLYFIVLRPAKRLANAGNDYVAGLQSGEQKEVFFPNPKKHQDEMTDLNDALYFTQQAIADYAEKVRDSAAYAERINADLRLAERIQLSMVPSAPLLGQRYTLRGYMSPAKEVGGDLFDYFAIDERHIGFFIGDVSGKGVPAALFMAKTQTLLRLLTASLDVNRVNAMLCEGNDEMLFVTAFIGVLDLETGLLRYVNCGHEPVFLFHNGQYAPLPANPNLALGCLEDIDFKVEERTLSLGDRLFLYTDGISEAMNVDGDLFGKPRILDTLNGAAELSNEVLLQAMRNAIADFVGEAPQSDDMCMLSLDYAKEGFLAFESTLEGLSSVPPFIDSFLSSENPAFVATIQVILDELCSNVVHYAGVEGAKVYLSLRINAENLYATLIDTGIPFDPTAPRPKHDDDQPGGLGIIMAKSMSDDLYYRRIGQFNVLRFTKKRGHAD